MTNQPPPPEELVSSETRIGQCLPTWSIHPAAAELGDVAALADHAMALRAALAAATARADRAEQERDSAAEQVNAIRNAERQMWVAARDEAEAKFAALSASLETLEQQLRAAATLDDLPDVWRWADAVAALRAPLVPLGAGEQT